METDFEARRRKLESTSGRLDSEIENSSKAADELAVQLPRLDEVRSKLAAREFAESERRQLATVNEKSESLDFDPKRREQTQAEYRKAGQDATNLETRVNQGTLALQRETDSLKRDLEEARNAQTQLAPAREELHALQTRLESEDYALDARTQASELEAVIAELQYDAEGHASVDALVSQLSEYSELHRSLLDATERLPTEREFLSAATTELSRTSEELSSAQTKQSEIQQALLALPDSESALRDAQANLNGIESRLDNYR
jgi:chromosome segregation ATPase